MNNINSNVIAPVSTPYQVLENLILFFIRWHCLLYYYVLFVLHVCVTYYYIFYHTNNYFRKQTVAQFYNNKSGTAVIQ